jgi:hypothetical protein
MSRALFLFRDRPFAASLLILFSLLQVTDVISTNRALAIPGTIEANPFMAASQAHLGPVWWLPKLALVAFAMVAVPHIRRSWPLMALCALYVALVLSNFAQS